MVRRDRGLKKPDERKMKGEYAYKSMPETKKPLWSLIEALLILNISLR